MMGVEGRDGAVVPVMLVALTVQVYVLPTVRFGTVMGDAVPGAPRATPPSEDEQTARYPVIGAPPFESGTSKLTIPRRETAATAVTLRGSVGSVGTRIEVVDAVGPVPVAFVA